VCVLFLSLCVCVPLSQRHRVMKRYDAASAFALRKHLNGSLEAFLGHDHPLASDSITEEAVHDYFQRYVCEF